MEMVRGEGERGERDRKVRERRRVGPCETGKFSLTLIETIKRF